MQKYKLGKHEVRVCGKTVETDAGIELVHSGSFIEFYGEIGKVSMKISGNADESDFAAYVGVFLNEGDTPETVWKIQNGLHHYEICWTSEKKNTVVKVMKLTEMQYGAVQIHSVDTDGNIKPTEPKERKLLFIGDSITAGYGVNGEQSDTVFTTKTEDVTKAYPYLTAKEVSADPWYVCWSGGGIISRWIPPETELPLTDILMPELFETGKDLDFIPSLISINLGTNDASYTRDDEGRKEKFGARYLAFVRRISEVYPDTPILLQYGLMERTLLPAIQTVAEECSRQGVKCYFLELPLMNKNDGMGTGDHPSVMTHKKTAHILKEKILELMDWKE